VWGVVGRLECSRGGVGEEWRWENEWARSRFERRGRRRGREGKKREGGPAAEVPHSAGRRRGAWPRPTGRAPVVARAERRGWHAGARGPAQEESGVVEPTSTVRFWIYLN
jgi:hypothetical protein